MTREQNNTIRENPFASIIDEQKEEDTISTDDKQAKTEKVYDLKGREIKFLISELTQPMYPRGPQLTELDEVRTKLLDEAEEIFNCKFVFEYIPGGLAAIKTFVINNAAAGVYFADAFRMAKVSTAEFEKLNIILPINDYIDLNEERWKRFDAALNYGVLYPENIYSFGEFSIHLPYALFYHENILSREGIPHLSEYKKQNNWTWETFLDIAIKTTKDFNGDGIIDQWGVVTDKSATIARAFAYSNLEPLIALKDGKFVYNLDSPGAMKALQFISDLYNTHKVIPNKDGEPDFFNNNAAMLVRDGWYGVTMRSQYPGQDIRYEELPYGPENPGNATIQKNAANHRFFFPINLKDPEAVIQAFAHWQFTSDHTKNYYVELKDLVRYNAETIIYDEKDYDYYANIYNSKTIFIEDYVDYFPPSITRMTNVVFNKIVTASTTAASAIESLKLEIESIIHDAVTK